MKARSKIKVGVIGGSGMTGEELLKFISFHPEIDLIAVSSRQLNGKKIKEIFPQIKLDEDIKFCLLKDDNFLKCDAIFFATPHGVSMSLVQPFLQRGVKIIDLSADFRINDSKIWESWYGKKHSAPNLLSQSTYGLTELNSKKIQTSDLVSVPGCYPTASLLSILPLFNTPNTIKAIVIDAKSGISGAGRTSVDTHLKNELKGNFKAYNVGGHRHYPEIKEVIESLSSTKVELSFVPHLLPLMRGIYITSYIQFHKLISDDLVKIYKSFYANSANVNVLEDNQIPSLRDVNNTNNCQIALFDSTIKNQVVVISAIDNLVKGASGQAIECFNLMFGFEVKLSLN